jgi:hypothetical protein
MNEHEEKIVSSFLVADKKARFLEMMLSQKKRRKFLKGLAHFHDLDLRYCQEVRSKDRRVESLFELLAKGGAPKECYVISESSKLDGITMTLREALESTVDSEMGTFISCLPGKLAYFENEDGGWLLQR